MDERTTATRRGATSLLLALLGSLAAASPGSGQISPRCNDAEYRELDLWVGEWEVRSPDGSVQGTSSIAIVRQLQERSEDGGVIWSVIFDARYHPVEMTGR